MTRDESFNGKVHCTHVFGVWWAAWLHTRKA